jgi:hypothetical protein
MGTKKGVCKSGAAMLVIRRNRKWTKCSLRAGNSGYQTRAIQLTSIAAK